MDLRSVCVEAPGDHYCLRSARNAFVLFLSLYASFTAMHARCLSVCLSVLKGVFELLPAARERESVCFDSEIPPVSNNLVFMGLSGDLSRILCLSVEGSIVVYRAKRERRGAALASVC